MHGMQTYVSTRVCWPVHASCLQEYVSLSFSPDGKLLLAQGGAPDWSLLLWTWEKSKVASSVRSTNLQGSPVVQVCVCMCVLCCGHQRVVLSMMRFTCDSVCMHGCCC